MLPNFLGETSKNMESVLGYIEMLFTQQTCKTILSRKQSHVATPHGSLRVSLVAMHVDTQQSS